MSNLNLTGQEHYILLQALNCYKIEIEKSEFKPNSIFTKEFIVNHVESLSSKINKLEEQFESTNSN
ncbi:hypothetical protein [Flavobacterium sp.]|uniref:hypothetical protein n=1 Tax=Flavobacterium sp. TaxID=239 RepID=UPI0037503135